MNKRPGRLWKICGQASRYWRRDLGSVPRENTITFVSWNFWAACPGRAGLMMCSPVKRSPFERVGWQALQSVRGRSGSSADMAAGH